MSVVRLYILLGFTILTISQGFASASSEEPYTNNLPDVPPDESTLPHSSPEESESISQNLISQNSISAETYIIEPFLPGSIPQDLISEEHSEDSENVDEIVSPLSPGSIPQDSISEEHLEDSKNVDEILSHPAINALQIFKLRLLDAVDVFEDLIDSNSISLTPTLIQAWTGWTDLPKLSAGAIGSWLLSSGQQLLNVGQKLEGCSVEVQRCPLNVTMSAINTCLTTPLRDLTTTLTDLIVNVQLIIGVFLDAYRQMTEDPEHPCSLEEKLQKLYGLGLELGQTSYGTLDDLGRLHGVIINATDGIASCFAREINYKVAIEMYGFVKYYFECIIR